MRKGARKKFLADRLPMSDEDCTALIGHSNTELSSLVIGIRRVIAKLCHVAPELIYPSDDPATLGGLMFDGWELLDVVFGLEAELGLDLPDTFEPPAFNISYFGIDV